LTTDAAVLRLRNPFELFKEQMARIVAEGLMKTRDRFPGIRVCEAPERARLSRVFDEVGS